MLRRCALLLTVALLLAAAPAAVRPVRAGEADTASLEILRDTIRANREALVDANLTLTDEEAAAFWPLYDRYHQELKAVQDRLVKVIEEYIAAFPDISDEKSMALIGEYLSIEEDRAKIRRTYLAEFAKVLPGRKVGRFYQIENKMDAVLRYDLAAGIPVVEE